MIRFDPATEQQSLLAGSAELPAPTDLAAAPDGALLVTDQVLAAVLEVDPDSGEATVLAQQGQLDDPFALTVVRQVPEPSPVALSACGAITLALLAASRQSLLGIRPRSVSGRFRSDR